MPYVSEELTHFVGRSCGGDRDKECQLLVKILNDRLLKAPNDVGEPWNTGITYSQGGRICRGETLYQRALVCFCDIPLCDLAHHMGKYGKCGLAFSKSHAVPLGASPVFYVASNSAQHGLHGIPADAPRPKLRGDLFDEMADQHSRVMLQSAFSDHELRDQLPKFLQDQLMVSDILHSNESLHVFGFVKCFDASLPDDHPENYYMEREWRLLGRLPFEYAHLSRVIVPRSHVDLIAGPFPDLADRIHPVD